MKRGFTLVEFATCMSIAAIMAPLLWATVRSIELRVDSAGWKQNVALEVRAIDDALLADLQPGDCNPRYELLDDHSLVRHAATSCGGDQTLARGVTRFERSPTGVELEFTFAYAGQQVQTQTVFLPWEAP